MSLARTAKVAAKIPLYHAFRRLGYPVLGPLAMSFVTTDRCNSRCKTCNIGQRYLDDPSVADDELTREEYARLFASIGRLEWVTFSGGEPFLRPDFPFIVGDLAEAIRPRAINIPTNATLEKKTVDGVAAILRRLGNGKLIVNLSVDGVGALHDEVRGFAGNFARLERTAAELRRLADDRLTIGVNTVLSRYNVEHASAIFEYVLTELRPDSYVVEVAQQRPEYYNDGERLRASAASTRRALDEFVARVGGRRRHGMARLLHAFRLKYYADQRQALTSPAGHRCFAGFSTCSVMPKGDVWSNTQRAELMGNIRDHGYDFPALWNAPLAQRVRGQVRAAACHCELSNASYTNALMDVSSLPRVFWYYARGS